MIATIFGLEAIDQTNDRPFSHEAMREIRSDKSEATGNEYAFSAPESAIHLNGRCNLAAGTLPSFHTHLVSICLFISR